MSTTVPCLSWLVSSNAQPMRPSRRRVSVSPRPRPRLMVVTNGTGPGFGNELLPRGVEPFVSGKREGLGYGLAMVRRIVERHGGQIELRSGADERTEVRVTLPT